MKRQHPDNPDLFWCPKCKGYKERGEFSSNSAAPPHYIASRCKLCMKGERNKSGISHISARRNKADENLFWCPRCEGFKEKECFYKVRSNNYGISAYCKEHTNERVGIRTEYLKEHDPIKLKMERRKTKEKFFSNPENQSRYAIIDNERAHRKYIKSPEKYRAIARLTRENMGNCYIKSLLRKAANCITEKAIDTKRTAITIKRIERSMINELTG